MNVNATLILRRGLTGRCPNCGANSLFSGLLRSAERCRSCALKFEREPGFFLGATVINYTLTLALLLPPVLVGVFMGRLAVAPALVWAVAWCILFPLLFYRPSKSLWLMTYYLFFPRQLPANGGSDQPLH